MAYRTYFIRFGDAFWFLLMLGVLVAYGYRRTLRTQPLGRQLLFALFYLYLLILLNFTFFPLALTVPPFYRPLSTLLSVALPFSDLYGLLTVPGGLDPLPLVLNIAGNVILFMPLGLFFPLLWSLSWRGVLASTFLASAAIEFAQLFLAAIGGTIRIVSSDDVLLNVVGALLGYGAFRLLQRVVQSQDFIRPSEQPVASERR